MKNEKNDYSSSYLYTEEWLNTKGERLTKPILCLDFDGVLHEYLSKWVALNIVNDGIVKGTFEALYQYIEHFEIFIFSTRSADPEGITAMKTWLYLQFTEWYKSLSENEKPEFNIVDYLNFSEVKPPGVVMLDDRALTFKGVWPDVNELLDFTPWNKVHVSGVSLPETDKNDDIPSHFNENKVSKVWKVPYEIRKTEAREWAEKHSITPASKDKNEDKICLLLIDVQNTFCIPEYELFVGGQSGNGAIEDNIRLCEFIYRNIGNITNIICTLDTHSTLQIFHESFWINDDGEHPKPLETMITLEDIEKGKWKPNPFFVFKDEHNNYLDIYVKHYVKNLTIQNKFPLTIWPYHAMLGSLGHAIVSSVEEACFFHSIARETSTIFNIKGRNPLTEYYSALEAEVRYDHRGNVIEEKNSDLFKKLLEYDKIGIAGQAKSHCVTYTINSLLEELKDYYPNFANQFYLLEDLTSPVVVPGVIDYTDSANEAYSRFAEEGMNIVSSTTLISEW